MITLDQARKIVELGDDLTLELSKIDAHLAAFHAVQGETVPCRAYTSVPDPFGRAAGAYATLLPVPKSQAISALERDRAKVVAKLAELGVEAPPVLVGDQGGLTIKAASISVNGALLWSGTLK